VMNTGKQTKPTERTNETHLRYGLLVFEISKQKQEV